MLAQLVRNMRLRIGKLATETRILIVASIYLVAFAMMISAIGEPISVQIVLIFIGLFPMYAATMMVADWIDAEKAEREHD